MGEVLVASFAAGGCEDALNVDSCRVWVLSVTECCDPENATNMSHNEEQNLLPVTVCSSNTSCKTITA